LELIRAEAELVGGRPAESFRMMMALGARAPAMGADAYPGAARAALWAGDVAGLQSVLDVWDRAMSHGTWPEADRAIFRAALAAMEGRRDVALAGFRAGLQAYRSLGMPFELARSLADTAIALGPGTPEAEQAAAEAREILTRLRVRPFLAKLDEVMTARTHAVPTPVRGTLPAEPAGQPTHS
jgi:plasmid stability protein